MSAAVEVLGVGELEELAADGPSLERLSVLVSPTPLVVRDTPGPVDLERVTPFLKRVPTVTVLWGSSAEETSGLAAAFDVCLTGTADPPVPWVHGEPEAVAGAVAAQPLAALALVGHLRSVEALDTWSGLAAESAVYTSLLGGAAFRVWRDGHARRASRPDPAPPVLLSRSVDRLSVVLNRPDRHNALDTAMRDALVEALQLAAFDHSVDTISLTGAGPSFCSGGDLDEFGSVGDGPVAHAVRLTRHPGWWVHACRDRLFVMVHGSCVGAGIELAAFAADIEAAPDAVFSLPELGMGLIPGAGGTVSITRRVGRQRSGWLALTGESIDAPTARRWGLVERIT